MTDHIPLDLSLVQCPTTLLVARQDVLTSMATILDAAATIPDARTLVLSGSHFVPLEHPDVVVDALAALASRCSLPVVRLYVADI